MVDVLVIDLDQIGIDFEDIGLYDIIAVVANREEGDAWVWSDMENLESDLLSEFNLDIDDEVDIAILDFETNELSRVDIKVTVQQEVVEKTKIELKINEGK